MKIFPFLVLIRPANILTAIADIIAGFAIAGVLDEMTISDHLPSLGFLIFSTIGLYAGGIVFNDLFDLETDRRERPERILPSGQISVKHAYIFGLLLLLGGVMMAFLAGRGSGLIALAITVSVWLYDKHGKHHPVLGPLNMGLCRGLNLLLGMSIVPFSALSGLWLLGILPVIFISAVTLTSRGEVSGNNKKAVALALFLDLVVASTVIFLGFLGVLNLKVVIPFVALWLGMNIYGKINAIIHNVPDQIMRAVKIGVISIIPLNASYVAGFGHWFFALVVLLLLPLAILLSRKFAVT